MIIKYGLGFLATPPPPKKKIFKKIVNTSINLFSCLSVSYFKFIVNADKMLVVFKIVLSLCLEPLRE